LDKYVVDQNGNPMPAIMMEETSHSVWVNSAALKKAGIPENVQDSRKNYLFIILTVIKV
jgi:predicted amidohydrolase YtcJ